MKITSSPDSVFRSTFSRVGRGWKVHSGLIFVQATFGVFHVVSKAVLGVLHPLALAGVRVSFAVPVLLLLAWKLDSRLPTRKEIPHLLLLGLLGVFMNQLCFIIGLNYTTATNAALLMPSIPVFAAAAAIVLGIEKISLRRLLGVGLTVVGAIVMLDINRFQIGGETIIGNSLILLNCLSFSVYLVLMRAVLKRLPIMTVLAWSFFFGGAGVLVVTFPQLTRTEWGAIPPVAWLGIAYIVIIPTTLNYWINTWAVARSTPTLVAAYITLQPLVAGMLAWFTLGEQLSQAQGVGGLLIIGGLYWVAWTRESIHPAVIHSSPPGRGGA